MDPESIPDPFQHVVHVPTDLPLPWTSSDLPGAVADEVSQQLQPDFEAVQVRFPINFCSIPNRFQTDYH